MNKVIRYLLDKGYTWTDNGKNLSRKVGNEIYFIYVRPDWSSYTFMFTVRDQHNRNTFDPKPFIYED